MSTMSSRAEGSGHVALSAPQNWPPPGQHPPQQSSPPPGGGWPPPGQNWPPPGQGWGQPGQGWGQAGQYPPRYGPQQHASRPPVHHWVRDDRPHRPAGLTAARIVVMIPSGIWLFALLMIWMFQGSFSESTLGPLVNTFILGLAAGDWAPMVLLPLAGCALTITMGTGHQIDRWIFTAAAALWTAWFWWNVHFLLTPGWLAAALVVAALLCVWNPSYNHWLKAVEMWEIRQAAPPPGGPGQIRQERPQG